MKYRSTRDASASPTLFSFQAVVETGYAPDGGLFVPEEFPTFSSDELSALYEKFVAKQLSYPDLAFAIFRKFISTDEIPDADLMKYV